MHASRSFLHHAARVVRRHGHLRVPPGKRLPDRRRVRPHQWRRSHLSVGLTKTKGTTMRELTTSNRSGLFARAEHLAAIVTLTIMLAGSCGGVNSAGGDAAAGTSGQGGHAGSGAGGTSGGGGAAAGTSGGGSGSGGATGRGGQSGTAGPGQGGRGGTTGNGGTGGQGATCQTNANCPSGQVCYRAQRTAAAV